MNMARRLLSVVLITQLLLPARAAMEVLLALAPSPTDRSESTAATPKPVTICPCTGAPACNCCGCCDEDTPLTEEPTSSSPAKIPDDDADQNQPEGLAKCTRCSCSPAAKIFSANVYLPTALCLAVFLGEPRPEVVSADASSYSAIFLPVDAPPPRA